MAEVAYSLEDAVTDLVEAPSFAPAVYDPGTIQESVPATSSSRGGLTVEQAAELIDDPATTGRAVAYHNGKPLSLSQLAQGYDVTKNLAEVLGDLHSRYRWVQQAGENVFIGTNAIAELLHVLFPRPDAALARTDPLGWQQAQVVYETVEDAAVQVIQYAQETARQQADWASNQIQRDTLAFETKCFLEDYPQAANPDWMAQFKARITNAAESFGFYEGEIDRVIDHRQLKILDYVASTLEKRQGSAKRESTTSPKRPRPRLVSSDDNLTMSEAMLVDFD